MSYTILDCYTDEPAGLGVPPYLGTYPRYIYGYLASKGEEVNYLTIDDLRHFIKNNPLEKNNKNKSNKVVQKTDIKTYNLTRDIESVKSVLDNTSSLIVIAGVHTPGKYLSALPGSLKEIVSLVNTINCEKILTGPAVYGSSVEGGKFAEKVNLTCFNSVKDFNFSYPDISEYSVLGATLVSQIPSLRIIEIETAKGCSRKEHCSFCTEPIKGKVSFRGKSDIISEVSALDKLGVKYFRLGKQSDYYSHPEAIPMVKEISEKFNPSVLHIDNVNPANVISPKGEEITKAIVKYCTPGNIAAFGVESFDPEVVKSNTLNSDPETTYSAVKILNKYGAAIGPNGMQKFLPGINLLFGLIGESKKTNEYNMEWLKRMLKENLLVRRINIRQVDIFEGTPLFNTVGNKFIKKNKKFYWKWRNDIRQEVDYPMLTKLVPVGTVMKDVRMEVYDGNNTFGRQIGTYPLIVGVKSRLELGKFYDITVVGHMLRSVIGEVKQ